MIKSEENTHPVAYLFVEEKEILQKTSASLSLPLDPGRKPILFSTPEVDSRLFKLRRESFLWAVGTVSILLRLYNPMVTVHLKDSPSNIKPGIFKKIVKLGYS